MMKLIAFGVSLLLTGSCFADTWTVDDDGKADFNNIQAALDAASDGDEIVVMPGTYFENLQLGSKSISLHSFDGPSTTTIDGNNIGTVVSIIGGAGQIIDGFTITNGSTSNSNDGRGAGMNLIGANNTTIQNCIFQDNSHTSGNQYSAGGIRAGDTSVTISNCQFIQNTSCFNGAALYLWSSIVNIENCLFENNGTYECSDVYALDIVHLQNGSTTTIENCAFDNNSFSSATIYLHIQCNLTLMNCLFENAIDTGNDSHGSIIGSTNNSDSVTLGNNTACSHIAPFNTVQIIDDLGGNIFTEGPCFDDCNNNGIDDLEDIANQTSLDCDANTVPDECDVDCNENGIPDWCDIHIYNTSGDFNSNGIPDECDPDCNGNGVPDDTDIEYGISEDCNGNGVPDECDLTDGGQVPEGAVQWTIEEGGNGHWYVVIDRPEGFTWLEASSKAIGLGSYIGSITSLEEDIWVYNNLNPDSCWLGAYQDINAEDYNEPSDGWRWMSGETWEYTNWNGGGPDNGGFSEPEEELASYCCSGAWNDIYEWDNSGVATTKPILIEFEYVDNDCDGNGVIDICEIDENPSLDCDGNEVLDSCDIMNDPTIDCNSDGVIDSCQIYDDPSLDCDGNEVLDSCDNMNDPTIDCNSDGVIDSCQIYDDPSLDCNNNAILDSCELAEGTPPEGPVQWTIEDGGNGHWYRYNWDQTTGSEGVCWSEARERCLIDGGDLVSVSSQAESDFIQSTICPMAADADGNLGWLGLMPDGNGTLMWSNGELLNWTNWDTGQPSGDGPYVAFVGGCAGSTDGNPMTWNDIGGTGGCHNSSVQPLAFWITEWSSFDEFNALDCNSNGNLDECDIADGTSMDQDNDGIPDECEVDCNSNSVPDHWDIKTGESQDCNDNGIPDECDIADSTSNDVNGNGIPDECEPDCNGNGIPDAWDIETGAAIDCNGNGIPDSCDANDCVSDCNLNGVPDECDIASGTSGDINENGIPDDCECAEDLSGDGVVGVDDLLLVIGYWGTAGPLGDLNADNTVGVADLLILISRWGECSNVPCGPPMAGAVQWPISEGGNGHWYVGVNDNVTWSIANSNAQQQGGHLATCTTAEENTFVQAVRDASTTWGGAWIGLVQLPEGSEPDGGWVWVTGEPLDWTNWTAGQPSNSDNKGAEADHVEMCCHSDVWGDWADGHPLPYIIEWSN